VVIQPGEAAAEGAWHPGADEGLDAAVAKEYAAACQRITAALLHEQGRCQYVSRQAAHLFALTHRASGSCSGAGTDTSGAPGSTAAPGLAASEAAPQLASVAGAAPSKAAGPSLKAIADAFGTNPSNPLSAAVPPPLPAAFASTNGAAASSAFAGFASQSASLSQLLGALARAAPVLRLPLPFELAYVYHCLKGGIGSLCHLRINNWVSVSLALRPPVGMDRAGSYDADGSASGQHAAERRTSSHICTYDGRPLLPPSAGIVGVLAGVSVALTPSDQIISYSETAAGQKAPGRAHGLAEATYGGLDPALLQLTHAPIRPYHTLLLLREASEVLQMLPPDASPQLALLVKAASPLRSFNELQGETGISSAQLLRLAAHLVNWGLAMIINCITSHSVYSVSAHAFAEESSSRPFTGSVCSVQSLAPNSSLNREFNRLLRGAGDAGTVGVAGNTAASGASAADSGSLWAASADESFTLQGVLSLFSNTSNGGSSFATQQAQPPFPANSLAGQFAAADTEDVRGGSSAPAFQSANSAALIGSAADGTGVMHQRQQYQQRMFFDTAVLPLSAGMPLRVLTSAMPPARARQFIIVVTWLLKKGLLRQLHQHIHLMWPWPMHTEHQSILASPAPGASASSLATAQRKWSTEEMQYIRILCKGKTALAIQLFRRLLVYLADLTAKIESYYTSTNPTGNDIRSNTDGHSGTAATIRDEIESALGPRSHNSVDGLDEREDLGQGRRPVHGLTASSEVSAEDHACTVGSEEDSEYEEEEDDDYEEDTYENTPGNNAHDGSFSASHFSSKHHGLGSLPIALRLGLRLEEIMWRLKASRTDILQVVAMYPEVFAVTVHE
jgi:hypothetical protein